jgi:integrase
MHDLRRAFGTRAADDGAPLNAIQAVMGHKSIATTMKYTQATDEGRRGVVRAAERKSSTVVKIWSKSLETKNEGASRLL